MRWSKHFFSVNATDANEKNRNFCSEFEWESDRCWPKIAIQFPFLWYKRVDWLSALTNCSYVIWIGWAPHIRWLLWFWVHRMKVTRNQYLSAINSISFTWFSCISMFKFEFECDKNTIWIHVRIHIQSLFKPIDWKIERKLWLKIRSRGESIFILKCILLWLIFLFWFDRLAHTSTTIRQSFVCVVFVFYVQVILVSNSLELFLFLTYWQKKRKKALFHFALFSSIIMAFALFVVSNLSNGNQWHEIPFEF